jgi:hypothetical protein
MKGSRNDDCDDDDRLRLGCFGGVVATGRIAYETPENGAWNG